MWTGTLTTSVYTPNRPPSSAQPFVSLMLVNQLMAFLAGVKVGQMGHVYLYSVAGDTV